MRVLAWLLGVLACPIAWAQVSPAGNAQAPVTASAEAETPTSVAPYAEVRRLIGASDWASAQERLQAWLQQRPQDAQARLLLGVVLAGRGDAEGARAVYETLTRDHPELPEPYNNLAVLHAAAGRLPEAREALQTALRFHPDYAIAHRNLGDVYAQLALGHWQRALALQPDTPGLGTRMQQLRTLLEPATGGRP